MNSVKPLLVLVDDERGLMGYYEQLLEQSFRLRRFLTASAALSFIQDHGNQISVLLFDVMMPPGTGFTSEETDNGLRTGLVFYNRVHHQFPKIPAVALTNSELSSVQKSLPKGSRVIVASKRENTPTELLMLVESILSSGKDGN